MLALALADRAEEQQDDVVGLDTERRSCCLAVHALRRGDEPAPVEAVVDHREIMARVERGRAGRRRVRDEHDAVGISVTGEGARGHGVRILAEVVLPRLAFARIPHGRQPDPVRGVDGVERLQRISVDDFDAASADPRSEAIDRSLVVDTRRDAGQRMRRHVHQDALGLVGGA